MKTYKVHDKAIVVVLTKKEAQHLFEKLCGLRDGLRATNNLLGARRKLMDALERAQ